jgi:hypothetical protein
MQALRVGDPEQVGAYRLVGFLGEGGQGAVYRGVAPSGEPVAVKLLHARFSGDAGARSRFAAELAHAGRVAAFCTARILDADVRGDRPYLVTEFVDGPTLSEAIAAGAAPRGPALDRLAIATVTALTAIHEAGVVHRDLKPGNVIMGPDGPRVIDFGIARALDISGTLSSAVVGTPAYMAPEQIGGAVVGPAADVFAWACTMAYASNGATPFGQDSIPAVMHRILHEEPDLGGLSGPLRDVVGACLAKDPARRPTAREVLLRLLGVSEAAPTAETLLIQGARASRQATLVLPHGGPPPGAPEASHAPPATVAPPRRARRAMARAVVAAALLLGAMTALPWANVGILRGELSIPTDDVGVAGLATSWGVVTLVMALAALVIAVADEFTGRVTAAWAAVPGTVAITALAGFLIRREDLHSEHPAFGLISIAEARGLGMTFRIVPVYGWYVALAMAVVLAALALTALAFRR